MSMVEEEGWQNDVALIISKAMAESLKINGVPINIIEKSTGLSAELIESLYTIKGVVTMKRQRY